MKHAIRAGVLSVALLLSVPAFAAWNDDVLAAINSGDLSGVGAIGASNPGAQGDMALFLLQQAQSKFDTDPDLAAKIFQAAAPFVAQVNPSNSPAAAGAISDLINKAKDTRAQEKSCQGSLTILGVALTMSTLPNLVAAAGNLHTVAMAAANDTLDSNPKCDTKALEDQVSLAENFGTPPAVGPLGALAPSSD